MITMAKYGFGRSEEHVFGDTFDSVEQVIEFAQRAFDEKNEEYFDDKDRCFIYVFSIVELSVTEFMPSLDDIADSMTDSLYGEHNVDSDAEVTYGPKEEAKKEYEAFIKKYFALPFNLVADGIIGKYDLKKHCWLKEE